MKQLVICILTNIIGLISSQAAVFQYVVPVENVQRPGLALLWIPTEASQVRGLLVSPSVLMERDMVRDPVVRKACADEQLGILFLKQAGFNEEQLPQILTELAAISGYRELPFVPMMFVGHSAAGPQAKTLAVKFADRCFGLMQYRGGLAAGGDAVPPGVPTLAMVGQFDEFGGPMRREDGRESWEGSRDHLAAYRAANEAHLASVVVEPGAGHFAWSERNAAYFAMFVRKAARARIPDWPVDTTQPVVCKTVDPQRGWLTDLTINKPGGATPAPVAEYKGDKTWAAWHFDRELAEATVAYHTGIAGKKDQFIQWKDPHWVDAGARYFFTKITWLDDGFSFRAHPVYADAYPKTGWPEPGAPVGHSTAPILVKGVGSAVVATGPDTLQFRFDGVTSAADGMRVTFMAYSVGDDQYRHTELSGMLPRGFSGLRDGKPQTITFPPIGNLKANSGPVELKASSDADLPVRYYVSVGPAVIENGKLKLSEIPARTSYPIRVTVVAWQLGRGIEPLVQTAKPVEQTIQIEKP